MESNNGGEILIELKRLKSLKIDIESQILALEAQLSVIETEPNSKSCSSPPTLSINGASSFDHALSNDMIYRYSRHLLLPSFGVQVVIYLKFGDLKVSLMGTQTLGMYYARLRSSWEELSHYDSFIEWPASAPSKNVPIPPMTAEIYAKIMEKTWVFQFLAGLKPDFEYAQVHLLDKTLFPTLEEAHAYCLSDQSLSRPLQVYTRRHPGRQSPTPDCQASSVVPGLPPTIDSPLSGIEPSPTAFIPVTTDDDSLVSHSDDNRPIAIRNEKRQTNLLKSSILVIGAGGLGSPALLYLAACGIGRLGIVDHDIVELNNLHRQIIHTEKYIGCSKVESAAAACRAINSAIQIVEHREALQASNALEIVSKYDIVIDATDNVPSRYMINDCCVVLGKPLISGAAVGLEGQLTVYNHNGGPCYRCLFPTPPPTAACQRCSDSGVLGVVPGVIGCLQALEAIKVASAVGEPLSGRMLLLDALSARIRIVKIRGRSLQCEVCGDNAAFSQKLFQNFDYEKFTQSPVSTAPLKLNLLPESARISSKEYKERITKGEAHVLVDVRPEHHFKIVSLPNSLSIPFSTLENKIPEIASALKGEEGPTGVDSGSSASLYVICRRGNDSQRAVQYLHKIGFTSARDIVGGLESWAKNVDPNFPAY
ncbi:hypothetical protein GIB67_032744 [Kingdonia uniflora]|uniref:Adenylyltransferase and sulfurtransferase MOCS3 n=1 Tax=Kingdonia uniflora TaxID=39325 RepID=A0A7J7MWC9_9MAGN|nr:hypothetical protein GIB67_032744 [Kingdonia uniflora]